MLIQCLTRSYNRASKLQPAFKRLDLFKDDFFTAYKFRNKGFAKMSSSLEGERDSRSTESSSIQAKERVVAAP